MSIAEKVKAAGASFIRGGAYKPRTSPYSFQALEKKGFSTCRGEQENRLPVVTAEIMIRDLETILQYTDIIQ